MKIYLKGYMMHTSRYVRLCLTILSSLLIIAGLACAGEIEYEKITVGSGRYLKWSPDGKYLSFIAGRGGGPLYLWEVATGETTKLGIAPTYFYDWLSNDRLIFSSRESNRKENHNIVELSTMSLEGEIKVIETDTVPRGSGGKALLRRLSNGQVIPIKPGKNDLKEIATAVALESIDTSAFFVVKNWRLWQEAWNQAEPDADIWLVRADGRPLKRITYGQGYGLPTLSPDGQFVCGRGGGTTVFNHDGKIVGKIQGSSSFTSWLSDSKRMVFERVEFGGSDGMELVAAELYIADYTGENEIQITHTPDVVEHEPLVSPDDSMIAYINYATFEVEILKIKGGLL